MSDKPGEVMSLYGPDGNRKYLTAEERLAFLAAAEKAPREVRTFCGLLAYSGCRISEALQLTADRVDLTAGVVIFESLKKRKRGVYRAVPLPDNFLDALNLVHGIREIQARSDGGQAHRLWSWSRMTAWRRFHDVMATTKIQGIHATPKGLRHGFGVAAVSAGVPLNLVQK